MQNKKNKKQNGGSNEGSVIFTYVLLTFVIGFILYCVYWCTSSGPENCKQFFKALDEGEWEDARGKFLEKDTFKQDVIKITKNILSDIETALKN